MKTIAMFCEMICVFKSFQNETDSKSTKYYGYEIFMKKNANILAFIIHWVYVENLPTWLNIFFLFNVTLNKAIYTAVYR